MDDDVLFRFDGAQPVQFGSSLGATRQQEDEINELLREGSTADGDSPSPEERRMRKRTASDRVVEELIRGRSGRSRCKGELDEDDLEWWCVEQ